MILWRRKPSRTDSTSSDLKSAQASHSGGGTRWTDSAPPSLLALIDLPFLQFLLLLIGISALIAAGWNSPREQQLQSLERELHEAEGLYRELLQSTDDASRWYHAIETDPRVEKELLEKVLGRDRNERGIPLELWLRGE